MFLIFHYIPLLKKKVNVLPAYFLILFFYICRALVDSGTDLGDREGLFLTSCVTIMVGETERRVVQQSIMPGHTHCTDIFIESWELLLNAKWNQVRQSGPSGLYFLKTYFVAASRDQML